MNCKINNSCPNKRPVIVKKAKVIYAGHDKPLF